MTGVSALRSWGAIGAVFLAQAAALGWIVWDRVALLEGGREVILAVEPVDPRSLFRGDYVILSYAAISQVSPDLLSPAPAAGQPVYVTLAKGENETWAPVAASTTRPDIAESGDRVVIAGTSMFQGGRSETPSPTPIKYGIESYFVPEGTGLEIEKMVGEKRVSALIAVGKDGRAAIKGLLADGGLIHRELAF